MNTKATTKTLTDVAAESARRVQDITGAPGEPAASCCDAVSPGNGYRCNRERGHITEHVAMTIDGEVCDTWPVETDDKPVPAPAKPATAEDFAKEEFARHPDGRIGARVVDDSRAWAVQSPTGSWDWLSDADMAAGGWQIVTPAPTTPREALALAVSLAYEPEGDTMPDQRGYMMVGKNGRVSVLPAGNPHGIPVRDTTYRRLLLDPPAPVTPARPEGAERYESLILDQMGGNIDPTAARTLADRIAREVEA